MAGDALPILNVLFLCTGNSARSILAEAILNDLGVGRFRAYSAGSHPKGAVHADAVDLLARRGHSTEGLRSKSWDEFARPDAPPIDLVVTVCDNAQSEPCPLWPGRPATVHWGIPDPAVIADTALRRAAFEDAYRRLRRRIEALVAGEIDAGRVA
jgi:arsenate reductase